MAASEILKFTEALSKGLLFLPRCTFKSTSLVTNLREESIAFAGTSYPTIEEIKIKQNANIIRPFYENCIAFSIGVDRNVVYKYQLFYEDLQQLQTTETLDNSVGVYIKTLDDFHLLRPFTNNIGVKTYGALSGNTQGRNYSTLMYNMPADEYRKVMDGAWSTMTWGNSPMGVFRTECGLNMKHSFRIGDTISERAIFKSRRVSDNGFDLYVTNNNVLAENWYWVVRAEGYFNRYWDVAGPPHTTVITQPNLGELVRNNTIGNYFYNASNPSPMRPSSWSTYFGTFNKPAFNLLLTNTTSTLSSNIAVSGLRLDTDCNICMLSTDNYGNSCDPTNNGPIFVIQPSLAYILEKIIKGGEYNVGLNLCVNSSAQSSDYLIDPSNYPLTNVFLANIFLNRITSCNNVKAEFCRGVDPITNESNLFTATCKDFCKNSFNCMSIVTDFCTKQSDPLSTTNKVICGCSRRDTPKVKEVYDRFVTDYKSKGLTLPNCDETKYIFSPCRTSAYGDTDNTTNRPPLTAQQCGSNINCVSYIEIDNDGTINGNIDIGIDQKGCQTIINKIRGNTVDCLVDSDCKNADGNPFCIEDKCSQCKTDSDCSTTSPFCDVDNICVQCKQNTDCSGDTPVCVEGTCVQCASTSDCGSGKKCFGTICVNECGKDEDCLDGKVCNNGVCVRKFNILLYSGISLAVLGVVFILILIFRSKKRL
jgi:hypothetical protein